MRSKKVTLSIPWRLWETYEKYAPAAGYADARRLLVWSPLYGISNNNPHHVTAPISKAPADVQDTYVNDLADRFDRGEFAHSSYLEHVIADVMTKLGVKESPETVLALVREALAHRPKGSRGPETGDPVKSP